LGGLGGEPEGELLDTSRILKVLARENVQSCQKTADSGLFASRLGKVLVAGFF
jgi:hypothetical protein